jgi:hypothetical protein
MRDPLDSPKPNVPPEQLREESPRGGRMRKQSRRNKQTPWNQPTQSANHLSSVPGPLLALWKSQCHNPLRSFYAISSSLSQSHFIFFGFVVVILIQDLLKL